MSNVYQSDVTALYFVNNEGESIRLPIIAGSMTRGQAGDLLTKITVGIPQPSYQCGYSVTGGGNVAWFVKDYV